MLPSVCVCVKEMFHSLSGFQFECVCTFALRVQAWVSGGISQRSASEAEAPGDEKSLLPCERGRGRATCEEGGGEGGGIVREEGIW